MQHFDWAFFNKGFKKSTQILANKQILVNKHESQESNRMMLPIIGIS